MYLTFDESEYGGRSVTHSTLERLPSIPCAGGVTIWNWRSHVSTSEPVSATVTAVWYGVVAVLGAALGASLTDAIVTETAALAVPPWPSETV